MFLISHRGRCFFKNNPRRPISITPKPSISDSARALTFWPPQLHPASCSNPSPVVFFFFFLIKHRQYEGSKTLSRRRGHVGKRRLIHVSGLHSGARDSISLAFLARQNKEELSLLTGVLIRTPRHPPINCSTLPKCTHVDTDTLHISARTHANTALVSCDCPWPRSPK